MNPIWYGMIIMVIQLGIFLLILDFFDKQPKRTQEHEHDNRQ